MPQPGPHDLEAVVRHGAKAQERHPWQEAIATAGMVHKRRCYVGVFGAKQAHALVFVPILA